MELLYFHPIHVVPTSLGPFFVYTVSFVYEGSWRQLPSFLKGSLNMQSETIYAKVFLQSSHPLILIIRTKITLNAVICMI